MKLFSKYCRITSFFFEPPISIFYILFDEVLKVNEILRDDSIVDLNNFGRFDEFIFWEVVIHDHISPSIVDVYVGLSRKLLMSFEILLHYKQITMFGRYFVVKQVIGADYSQFGIERFLLDIEID